MRRWMWLLALLLGATFIAGDVQPSIHYIPGVTLTVTDKDGNLLILGSTTGVYVRVR